MSSMHEKKGPISIISPNAMSFIERADEHLMCNLCGAVFYNSASSRSGHLAREHPTIRSPWLCGAMFPTKHFFGTCACPKFTRVALAH